MPMPRAVCCLMALTLITILIDMKKGRTGRPHWQLEWLLKIKYIHQILAFAFVELNFLTC
ncbi:hypothetical protein G781_01573 [Escherichia coli HVH 119 (4-6879578)]|nr:hypothetical protein G781_01573 [Escherichia coli HVH 119 (4-6879578)]